MKTPTQRKLPDLLEFITHYYAQWQSPATIAAMYNEEYKLKGSNGIKRSIVDYYIRTYKLKRGPIIKY